MKMNRLLSLISFTSSPGLLLGLGLISLLDLPGWRAQASPVAPGNQAARPRAAKAEAAARRAPLNTITVNSTADGPQAIDGACTLREALLNANNANQAGSSDCAAGSATSNTITFNLPAGPQTINLTERLPRISRGLIISGPGARLLTVRRDTGGDYRIFEILISALDVSIYGLTINNGRVVNSAYSGGSGGGILSYSNLKLGDCNITGNTALNGGGVYLDGADGVFVNCNFSSNTSSNTGGAISFAGNAFVRNRLRLSNCTISNNFASSGSSGIHASGTTVEVTNCTIADNTK